MTDAAAPVLIYGAVGGVGEATARRLIAQGRTVHLAARRATELGSLTRELGCTGTVCDVLDTGQLQLATAEAGGRLSGLVFAVGSIDIASVARASRDAFRASFELNAVSAAEAVRVAAPALKAGKGSVVLFSTVAASQGFQNHAVIAAAKGAVEGLVLSFAADLAPDVRVNAVAPSLMRTPLGAQLTSNAKIAEAIAAMHPVGRLGEADDAAALTAFLLSPEAGWITGQVIGVDGGRSTVRTKG
jgi:NAD(P)-dependent dehydrogenase (short-subunit alcohol dehydrogenase family)